MRELTKGELDRFFDKGCIFCGSEQFFEGPSGGMMVNLYCANEECEAGFNIPPANVRIGGQVIRESKLPLADRIDVASVPVSREQVAAYVSHARPWLVGGLAILFVLAIFFGAYLATVLHG